MNKGKNDSNAMEYYQNIKKSFSGLKEILRINFNEKDFYYQAGMDNLEALKENIIDLLQNSCNSREIRIKLREFERDKFASHEKLI
ncbi:MAG: hypothetical protein ACTSRI_09405 [Promethearchaeota archaeon]